ncbi:MAG: hypothetical protein AAF449_04075, partial [Myxococcota bacterium]
GAHVVGKTIGELGYGNTPADILSFAGQDQKQNPFEVMLITHKNQAAQVLSLKAVEAAVTQPGLSEPVMMMNSIRLGAASVPLTNVMHIDEQDPMQLFALRRNLSNGGLELVSYLKNVYFRISDFQSEYEIPGYSHEPS